MAVITLVDTLKDDLKFLHDQPNQIVTKGSCYVFLKVVFSVVGEFCKLAWSYIYKGHNVKMYQNASQKLQIRMRQIQSVVESLADFFIESGKNELDADGFKEAVVDLGLSEDLASIIYNEYLAQKNILTIGLPQAGMDHLQFKNLEWRFETQVINFSCKDQGWSDPKNNLAFAQNISRPRFLLSSKSMKKQIEPRVVIRLDLEKWGKGESICLQSSIPNVIHMSQIMSQALQDSRTQHSKRIQRAVT